MVEPRERLELRARVEARLVTGDAAEPARRLLYGAEWAYLATAAEGWPYVMPLAFVYDGTAIHFHCGDGLMASLLAAEPRACLSVTTGPQFTAGPSPCEHSFRYESTLAFGEVSRIDDDAQREEVLRRILAKYHPSSAQRAFSPERFAATLVFVLRIDALTYKRSPEA